MSWSVGDDGWSVPPSSCIKVTVTIMFPTVCVDHTILITQWRSVPGGQSGVWYTTDWVCTVVEGMRYLRDWRTSVLISSVLMCSGAVLMCGGAVLMSGGAVLMCGGAVLMCGGGVLIFRSCRFVLCGREISGWSVLR